MTTATITKTTKTIKRVNLLTPASAGFISLRRQIRKNATGSYFTAAEMNEAKNAAMAEIRTARAWKGTLYERSTDAFILHQYWNNKLDTLVLHHAVQLFLLRK